jgi:hypothetical protein
MQLVEMEQIQYTFCRCAGVGFDATLWCFDKYIDLWG